MRASRTRTIWATAAVMTGLIALSGCGGDTRRGDDLSTTAGAAAPVSPQIKLPHGPAVSAKVTDPARRAYIARADRLCAHFDPKRNEARKHAGEAADTAEAVTSYDEGIKLGEQQLRALEAIPPPPGDRALLRANVFTPLKTQLAIRRQIAPALAHGDVAQLRPLQTKLDALTRSLEGFANGYGYRVCGGG